MNRFITPLFLLLSINFLLTGNAISGPFFAEDYEGAAPAAGVANPIWSLTPIFDTLHGPGNNFEVTTNTCHSGTKSMRFSYRGRNSFCNNCGSYGATHLDNGLHDGVDYFITNENLTARENSATTKRNDGPKVAPGKLIFNKTNGFSTWEVSEVVSEGGTKNRLNLIPQLPGIGGETPEFNGGDEVAITRMCGVDGHIGGDINRRNDCDGAIIFFGGVTAADQGPGESIWRRMYLKAELSSAVIHQKLHYWKTDNQIRNSSNTANIYNGEVVIFGDSSNGRPLEVQITGFQQMNGTVYRPFNGNNPPTLPELEFKRGKWYYIEEEFKAATLGPIVNSIQTYNQDGEYRLWFSEAGLDTGSDNPQLEVTNLTMGPLRDPVASLGPNNSFWGNIQHFEHTVGNWYIDDMFITGDTADTFLDTSGSSRRRIGPVNTGICTDKRVPKPASITN